MEKMNIKGGGSPQTVQGGCPKGEVDSILKAFYEENNKSILILQSKLANNSLVPGHRKGEVML